MLKLNFGAAVYRVAVTLLAVGLCATGAEAKIQQQPQPNCAAYVVTQQELLEWARPTKQRSGVQPILLPIRPNGPTAAVPARERTAELLRACRVTGDNSEARVRCKLKFWDEDKRRTKTQINDGRIEHNVEPANTPFPTLYFNGVIEYKKTALCVQNQDTKEWQWRTASRSFSADIDQSLLSRVAPTSNRVEFSAGFILNLHREKNYDASFERAIFESDGETFIPIGSLGVTNAQPGPSPGLHKAVAPGRPIFITQVNGSAEVMSERTTLSQDPLAEVQRYQAVIAADHRIQAWLAVASLTMYLDDIKKLRPLDYMDLLGVRAQWRRMDARTDGPLRLAARYGYREKVFETTAHQSTLVANDFELLLYSNYSFDKGTVACKRLTEGANNSKFYAFPHIMHIVDDPLLPYLPRDKKLLTMPDCAG